MRVSFTQGKTRLPLSLCRKKRERHHGTTHAKRAFFLVPVGTWARTGRVDDIHLDDDARRRCFCGKTSLQIYGVVHAIRLLCAARVLHELEQKPHSACVLSVVNSPMRVEGCSEVSCCRFDMTQQHALHLSLALVCVRKLICSGLGTPANTL